MSRWPIKPGMLTIYFPEEYLVMPVSIEVYRSGAQLFSGVVVGTILHILAQDGAHKVKVFCNTAPQSTEDVWCEPDGVIRFKAFTVYSNSKGLRRHAERAIDRQRLLKEYSEFTYDQKGRYWCEPSWAGVRSSEAVR